MMAWVMPKHVLKKLHRELTIFVNILLLLLLLLSLLLLLCTVKPQVIKIKRPSVKRSTLFNRRPVVKVQMRAFLLFLPQLNSQPP